MSKRFTETRKWQNTWFMDLPAKYKLAWYWALDNCDCAGLIDANPRLMSFVIGEPIDGDEFLRMMAGRVIKPKPGKWFIPPFITFQYGDQLHARNSAHRGVLRILREQEIDCPVPVSEQSEEAPSKPLQSPSVGAKDKDKDKDKDQDQDKDKHKAPSANEIAADGIWALYPKKTGKKEAMREIVAAIRANGADRIRDRVQAYSAAVAQWPEDERKYVPDPVRWFKRGNYDDDPQTWQRKSANGVPQLEAHLNVF